MTKWMSEWMNEWINELMIELMNIRMTKWMKKRWNAENGRQIDGQRWPKTCTKRCEEK